jgi:alpha-L-fucosidase
MWFDGEWEEPWTHAMGVNLYRHIRAQQADILINNRVDKGRRGMEGVTTSGEFLGDYDTPEQQVGGFNRTKPWESCITICRQWSWKPDDELKSLKECVQTLVRTVGGDGNLLLNVGPMSDGSIEPRQVERLQEIGGWLKQFGDGIYGTRGGPFKPGPWGASTCKADKIFLYVVNWPAMGPLRLPSINQRVRSARTLTAGEAGISQSRAGIAISLGKSYRNDIASIIELTVDGIAADLEPADMAAPQ